MQVSVQFFVHCFVVFADLFCWKVVRFCPEVFYRLLVDSCWSLCGIFTGFCRDFIGCFAEILAGCSGCFCVRLFYRFYCVVVLLTHHVFALSYHE